MEPVGNDMPSLSLEEDVTVTNLVGMHGNELKFAHICGHTGQKLTNIENGLNTT